MIPSRTYNVIGASQMEACAAKHDPANDYVVLGVDLNDLAALALRFNETMTDANELRDWQNRIDLMLSRAERLEN